MPIDISGSIVKQSVKFDRPIRGRQLIEAVKQTCEAKGSKFSETKEYDDGWRHAVGQSSSTPYENVLVTPNRTDAFIEPDALYSEAVVLRHDSAAGGTRTLARYTVENEVDSVVQFAESLQRTVNHGPGTAVGVTRSPQTRAEEADTSLAPGDAARSWDPPSDGYRTGRRDLSR
jgi:hypothetical protein